YSSAEHCHLTPYPTRRSSDLFRQRKENGRRRQRISLRYCQPGRRHTRLSGRHRPRLRLPRDRVATVGARLAAESDPSPAAKLVQDRKSTRLNSSHVKISYAVF